MPDPSNSNQSIQKKEGVKQEQGECSFYKSMVNLMSIDLLEVYNGINTKYFRNKGHSSPSPTPSSQVPTCDDKEFNLKVTIPELIEGRYQIEEYIGKGSFGKVYRCYDLVRKCEVAIKIIRSKSIFYKQGLIEIETMKYVTSKINAMAAASTLGTTGSTCAQGSSTKDLNPTSVANNANTFGPSSLVTNNMFVIKYHEYFLYKNHLCIVTELLYMDLYKTIQSTRGLTINLIKKIAYQILVTLSFLRRDDVNIIHADLKPENIMRKCKQHANIRIGDFGSSIRLSGASTSNSIGSLTGTGIGNNTSAATTATTTTNQVMLNHYIQSRYYRAPEVILGLNYDHAIDMWSLGCILVELHTGKPIFKGTNEVNQLVVIAEILGIPPEHMIEKSPKKYKFFAKREENAVVAKIVRPTRKEGVRRKGEGRVDGNKINNNYNSDGERVDNNTNSRRGDSQDGERGRSEGIWSIEDEDGDEDIEEEEEEEDYFEGDGEYENVRDERDEREDGAMEDSTIIYNNPHTATHITTSNANNNNNGPPAPSSPSMTTTLAATALSISISKTAATTEDKFTPSNSTFNQNETKEKHTNKQRLPRSKPRHTKMTRSATSSPALIPVATTIAKVPRRTARKTFVPLPQTRGRKVMDREDPFGLCRGINTKWVFRSSVFNVKGGVGANNNNSNNTGNSNSASGSANVSNSVSKPPTPRNIEDIFMDPSIITNKRGTEEDYKLFIDFLSKVFIYDPALRIHPKDALLHPFVN